MKILLILESEGRKVLKGTHLFWKTYREAKGCKARHSVACLQEIMLSIQNFYYKNGKIIVDIIRAPLATTNILRVFLSAQPTDNSTSKNNQSARRDTNSTFGSVRSLYTTSIVCLQHNLSRTDWRQRQIHKWHIFLHCHNFYNKFFIWFFYHGWHLIHFLPLTVRKLNKYFFFFSYPVTK